MCIMIGVTGHGIFVSKGGWINAKWEGKPHMFPNQIRFNMDSYCLKKEGMVWKHIQPGLVFWQGMGDFFRVLRNSPIHEVSVTIFLAGTSGPQLEETLHCWLKIQEFILDPWWWMFLLLSNGEWSTWLACLSKGRSFTTWGTRMGRAHWLSWSQHVGETHKKPNSFFFITKECDNIRELNTVAIV